jgi:hypothetical protein
MAGNPVLIARNAQMMIHEGFAMAVGNAQDMRDLAEQLDKASNNIASIYSDHTGKPINYFREVMKAETWYDADECINEGLADRLIDSGAGRRIKQPDDKWDMSVYHASGRQTLPPGSRQPVQAGPWDPDGDGDDDSRPETDTDHSHWNDQGRQIQSVPGRPLVDGNLVDIRNASVDNSPWDASRAMHNAAQSDNPASFYGSICAGKRSGDPSTAEAHALPHHYHPGDAPNAAGVRNALSRLSGTQGLTNESAAKSHLEGHMRTINPDWSPDNSSSNPFGLSDEDIERFSASLRL